MASAFSTQTRRAVFLLGAVLAAIASATATLDISAHSLPILFFHGVTANATSAYNLQKNLSTAERPFIALSFCENQCSARDLPTQVDMAINQIRAITSNDSRFDNGYIIIGHSQGGLLARAVIEEMDDHKAHTFISLAGAQNGIFYGPQINDGIPKQAFLKRIGPEVLPVSLFNFTNYSDAEIANGKIIVDFTKLVTTQPTLQGKISVANMVRSPVSADWRRVNTFLPLYNGLLPSKDPQKDCTRRKQNFLKLEAAHFFASPADDVIAPWQSSVLGKYEDVESLAALETNYAKLKVVSMTETLEFKRDTYGLKTLRERRGLFLHEVPGVSHRCWIADSTPLGAKEPCKFQAVFEKNLYPLLAPLAAPTAVLPK